MLTSDEMKEKRLIGQQKMTDIEKVDMV